MLSLFVVIQACAAAKCHTYNLPVDMQARGPVAPAAFEVSCMKYQAFVAEDFIRKNHPDLVLKDSRCEWRDPNRVEAEM